MLVDRERAVLVTNGCPGVRPRRLGHLQQTSTTRKYRENGAPEALVFRRGDDVTMFRLDSPVVGWIGRLAKRKPHDHGVRQRGPKEETEIGPRAKVRSERVRKNSRVGRARQGRADQHPGGRE